MEHGMASLNWCEFSFISLALLDTGKIAMSFAWSGAANLRNQKSLVITTGRVS